MNIRHLKIFVIVYQNMSVTKAAKILHIAQPAVTRSIQDLENDYGVCLFDRLNHRLYRTPLADELYTRACYILDSLDELDSTLRQGIIRFVNMIMPPSQASQNSPVFSDHIYCSSPDGTGRRICYLFRRKHEWLHHTEW